VIVPVVVVDGTSALTGVTVVPGVVMAAATAKVVRFTLVAGVTVHGVVVAATCALMGVLMESDGTLCVCPVPRLLHRVGLVGLSMILVVCAIVAVGTELWRQWDG
jgi:hypothetical protein